MADNNSTRACKKCGILFSGVRCKACMAAAMKKLVLKARLVDLSAERVRALFDYDPADGRLHRKDLSRRDRRATAKGYFTITIDNRVYQEHRVVWLWHYGEWPKQGIDHIDRNPLNNRIENLRDVPQSENKQNQLVNKNNKTGLKGVWKVHNVKSGAWIAQITHKGKNIYLGYFKTPEAAHEAYCKAAAIYHTVNPLSDRSRLST